MAKELSTPRSVQTKNTKEKIYKAAVNIMKKKGYEYLSVNNICTVAGVSNGTFFYHFKTKEDLLSYYLRERFAEYRTEHNFNVDGLPFDKKIVEYYRCYTSYVMETGIDFISSYYTPKMRRSIPGPIMRTGRTPCTNLSAAACRRRRTTIC